MKLNKKALGAAIIEGSNMAGERLVTQIVTAYLEALGAAPAAMPSEEEIARAMRTARLKATSAAPMLIGYSGLAPAEDADLASARAILDLIHPAFEAKEREIERACADHANATIGWERERGLREAAEAALAAERGRCIAIVDAQVPDWVKERSGPYWEGYRDAMEDAADDMRKGSAPHAAAIRAQGE